MIPVRQITHSTPPAFVGTEYASVDCVSPDNNFILAIARDHFILLSTAGTFIKDLKIGASDQPQWVGPNILNFRRGNQIMQMNVETEVVASVRTFDEYATIDGKGESNYRNGLIALCGDDHDLFVFDLERGVKSQVRKYPGTFDSLYVTPDGNVLLSDNTGILMFDRNMNFLRAVAAHDGHHDICRDIDGREVMVVTDNNDNAVYKVPLDGRPRTKLLDLPWPVAVDISCPAQSGWAGVSTYSLNLLYPGQVLKVALDGSGSEVLCNHESVMIAKPGGGMYYNPQPKTVCTERFLVGSSNFGKTADPNYCDVFMVALDAVPFVSLDVKVDFSQFIGRKLRLVPQPDGHLAAMDGTEQIDYRPYVGKKEWSIVGRPDKAFDMFEHLLKA